MLSYILTYVFTSGPGYQKSSLEWVEQTPQMKMRIQSKLLNLCSLWNNFVVFLDYLTYKTLSSSDKHVDCDFINKGKLWLLVELFLSAWPGRRYTRRAVLGGSKPSGAGPGPAGCPSSAPAAQSVCDGERLLFWQCLVFIFSRLCLLLYK